MDWFLQRFDALPPGDAEALAALAAEATARGLAAEAGNAWLRVLTLDPEQPRVEAAAFGDLSENSEFTAALEKRDQLTSRATRMESELKRAQVIPRELPRGPVITIGSRVLVRNLATEGEETYTFLGPWDSDAQQRILTYNAPLALAFMGKRVGEVVVFGEGDEERRWEVLALEAAV